MLNSRNRTAPPRPEALYAVAAAVRVAYSRLTPPGEVPEAAVPIT